MKLRKPLLIAAGVISLTVGVYAAYQYYYTETTYTHVPSNWTINNMAPTYLEFNGSGSAISNVGVPDGSSDYEVRTNTIRGGGCLPGATFVHYLRATTDAYLNPSFLPSNGDFYAVMFDGSQVRILRHLNYTYTWLASMSYSWTGAADLRSVITANGTIIVYANGVRLLQVQDSGIASGKPGIGGWNQVLNSCYWNEVKLGPLDRVAPAQVNPLSILATPFPNYVDLQWAHAADDANGTGVIAYEVYRNGTFLAEFQGRSFTDPTVSPGTTYSYSIRARDFHNNLSANNSVSVTTPPTGAVDARRIGVRGDGSYWGAAGEQIDVRSGNLNFTMPLVRAEGRGGWGVGFSLNYNSQNWRKDSGMWKLGGDVGYGFGWRLMAGSILPVYSNSTTVHHYVFTDGTGAEYRLDVNSGGVWTSREGVYVKYDANQAKLFFPDGSAWEMNSVSALTEDDAGTRYPTKMEDTHGNWVGLEYRPGKGVAYVNSSARIAKIEDVRATAPFVTYQFTYNTDATPHLTGITNNISTAENYTFSYTVAQTLYAPFAPQTAFGTAQMLQTVTRTGVNLTHTFEYGTNGAGEMSRAIQSFMLGECLMP